MPLKEPGWWYPGAGGGRPNLALRLAGDLWSWVAVRRYRTARPYRAAVPVICVGNFTAGGTGKTPLAIFIARQLQSLGKRPVFLSRGYGGRTKGPHKVNPQSDTARDVGDEPLLLALTAPTIVCRNRIVGAKAIEALVPSPDVIIMDDGLQNPSLEKDVTIAVVDSRRGVGNGFTIPAGPLRAPLDFQLAITNAIVINHGAEVADLDKTPSMQALRKAFGGPVFDAAIRPAGETSWIPAQPLLAFAGIANPARFYNLLRALGGDDVVVRTFNDHQPLKPSDAEEILATAKAENRTIVTTEKDWSRLDPNNPSHRRLRDEARTLPITLHFEDATLADVRALLVRLFETAPRT